MTITESGRPWPVLDEDPVVDYMILEAVRLKVAQEKQQAEKDAERAAWRKDKSGFDSLRERVGG